MFEAKILQGAILKKIIEAIRELVTDANLDVNERGITMQVSALCPVAPVAALCSRLPLSRCPRSWRSSDPPVGHGLVSCVIVCHSAQVGRLRFLQM